MTGVLHSHVNTCEKETRDDQKTLPPKSFALNSFLPAKTVTNDLQQFVRFR